MAVLVIGVAIPPAHSLQRSPPSDPAAYPAAKLRGAMEETVAVLAREQTAMWLTKSRGTLDEIAAEALLSGDRIPSYGSVARGLAPPQIVGTSRMGNRAVSPGVRCSDSSKFCTASSDPHRSS